MTSRLAYIVPALLLAACSSDPDPAISAEPAGSATSSGTEGDAGPSAGGAPGSGGAPAALPAAPDAGPACEEHVLMTRAVGPLAAGARFCLEYKPLPPGVFAAGTPCALTPNDPLPEGSGAFLGLSQCVPFAEGMDTTVAPDAALSDALASAVSSAPGMRATVYPAGCSTCGCALSGDAAVNTSCGAVQSVRFHAERVHGELWATVFVEAEAR